MFESIKGLWHEARGTQLKKEFDDLVKKATILPEIHAERYGRTVVYMLNDWQNKFGPVQNTAVSLRKTGQTEFRKIARQRYETDIGVASGYALFSIHLESSYLLGEDATTVYSDSSTVISMIIELARKVDERSRIRNEDHES